MADGKEAVRFADDNPDNLLVHLVSKRTLKCTKFAVNITRDYIKSKDDVQKHNI